MPILCATVINILLMPWLYPKRP
ncbi:hypothetical protein F1520_11110 [Yersinia pestis]|nr:hypothetical protein EGX42_13385 [Yersinia pestis]AYX17865.1 hypothetical protein EGX44_16825 [Yersinia pseudotuberculosis]QFR87232.1 hypothetical protein DJY80_00390 [Yersinia pestis subsp. pestis bv. Medievalis]AYX22210.1 hypothetical protein EGX46_21150 [Yersinia pestis]AYX26354.1 hypothetical protein EGX74_04540 [Yersinia pestis]